MRSATNFKPFALAWDAAKLRARILEIGRWRIANGDEVISLDRRREIARDAHQLLLSLDGLGGLDDRFLDTLRALAHSAPDFSGHGGNCRLGQRTADGSVLGMLVQLYTEAHQKPRFSITGPLVQFVNDAGALLLNKPNPFSANTIKGEFQKARGVNRKPRGLRSLYER